MPAPDAFVSKIREQISFLQNEEYNYDQLNVYVSGIGEPWEFDRANEFEFVGDEILLVREGPADEQNNHGVPEFVFPIRQIVATELAVSED